MLFYFLNFQLIDKLNVDQLLDYIFGNMANLENVSGLCGDMLAVKVVIESAREISPDKRNFVLGQVLDLQNHFKRDVPQRK